MRVLILSNSYVPVLGGLQTVTHGLAKYLVARGHEVKVLSNKYPRRLLATEVVDGVAVQRWFFLTPTIEQWRRQRLDLLFASLGLFPLVQMRLNRWLRSYRPVVVNIHYPDCQVPFLLRAGQREAFRLVVSLHGYEVERWFDPDCQNRNDDPVRTRLKALLRNADAVTACSRYLLTKAIALEPAVEEKGYVIHNGIESERFLNQRRYRHPRRYVFAFGRLTWQKGFDLLLESFSQVSARFPDTDLIIAGEGEERDRLESMLGRLGLGDRVHLVGRADPEQVVELLNGSIFAVVPSRFEPFGIVALEAIAAGKSVVATNVGGLREILEPIWPHDSEPGLDPGASRKGVSSESISAAVSYVDPTVEGLKSGLVSRLGSDSGAFLAPAVREAVLDKCNWRHAMERYEEILLGSERSLATSGGRQKNT